MAVLLGVLACMLAVLDGYLLGIRGALPALVALGALLPMFILATSRLVFGIAVVSAVLVGVISMRMADGSWDVAVGAGVANAAGGFVVALLMRASGRPAIDPGQVFGVFALIGAASVMGVVGAVVFEFYRALAFELPVDPAARVAWASSTTVGSVCVTPFLLSALSGRHRDSREGIATRAILLFVLMLALAGFAAYRGELLERNGIFVVFPLLILGCFILRPPEMAIALLAIPIGYMLGEALPTGSSRSDEELIRDLHVGFLILAATTELLAAALAERGQARQLGEEREQRYRRLIDAIDHAGVVVATGNSDGVSYANGTALEVAGLTSFEEVRGRRWGDVAGQRSSDFVAIFREINESWGRHPLWSGDALFERGDGSVREIAARVVEWAPREHLIVGLDVTDERATAREVVRSRKIAEEREKRMRALVDALDRADLGIIVRDIGLTVTEANHAAARALGLANRQLLIGNSIANALAGARPEASGASADDVEADPWRPEADIEIRWRRPDGSLGDLGILTRPAGPDGPIVSLLTDVTLRNQVRAESDALREQLRRAQRLDAIGRLGGGLAHEINNLLQPVMTYASLALTEPDPDQRSQQLARVLEGVRRTRSVIDNVLLFARGGEADGGDAAAPLITCMGEAIAFVRHLLPSTVTLEYRPPADDVYVRVGQTALAQVLINLLDNACYAMSARGHITIETRVVDAPPEAGLAPGEYCHLDVGDSGPGISPELKDRILEPFFTTKPIGVGTGLGLSVVYGIIRGWGGTLTVLDSRHGGALFRVWIPTSRDRQGGTE